MTNKLAETCSISYHVTPSRMCNSHLSNNSDPVQFNQNVVSTTCHTPGWEMVEGRRKVEANNKQSLRKSPDVTTMRSGEGSDGFLVKLKESDKPKYEGSIITHWHLVDPTLPAVVKEQSDLTQGDAHQAQDRCSLQTGEEHIMIQMSNLINLYFIWWSPRPAGCTEWLGILGKEDRAHRQVQKSNLRSGTYSPGVQAFSASLDNLGQLEISILVKECIFINEERKAGFVIHLLPKHAKPDLSWEQENTEEQVRGGDGAYEVGQAQVAVAEPPVPSIFVSFHLLIYHTPMSPHLWTRSKLARRTELATVPAMEKKMALAPNNVLSPSPKMMLMSSGWLSRVCTQEAQEAFWCQHGKLVFPASRCIARWSGWIFHILQLILFILVSK